MITPDEALRRVLESVSPLATESVGLEEACGRVLAEDLFARRALPAWDNSAMDGYAVRSADLAGAGPDRPVALMVRGTARAGGPSPARVSSGEAVRVMTGAPLPGGADAVVMREKTLEEDERVRVLHRPSPGECVRRRGEDVLEGRLLLKRGMRLRPLDISLLAAQGLPEAPVVRRPRVSLVTTGDEVGADERAGGVRDANGPALAAALLRAGAVPAGRRHAGDDSARLEEAFRQGLDAADVLAVSGGVSAGDFDFTRRALDCCGFREVFWKVAIKPGMPLLFGLCPGNPPKAVFGLPGNPLSALVCLEEFVLPGLDRMQGAAGGPPRYPLEGRSADDFSKPLEKQQYLFCRAEAEPGGFRLRILKPQGSALVRTAAEADALAVAPLGVEKIRPGDKLAFRWLA